MAEVNIYVALAIGEVITFHSSGEGAWLPAGERPWIWTCGLCAASGTACGGRAVKAEAIAHLKAAHNATSDFTYCAERREYAALLGSGVDDDS